MAKFTGNIRNELKRKKYKFSDLSDYKFLRYGRFCTKIQIFYYAPRNPSFLWRLWPQSSGQDCAPGQHMLFGLRTLASLVSVWIRFTKIFQIKKYIQKWSNFQKSCTIFSTRCMVDFAYIKIHHISKTKSWTKRTRLLIYHFQSNPHLSSKFGRFLNNFFFRRWHTWYGTLSDTHDVSL